MEFYILGYSLEPKKSAIISGFDPGYISLEVFRQGDLGYHDFPKEKVVFSGLHLEKGAVIVDFIYAMGSYGGFGYLMSEKAKNILENFNLPTHKFYELPILEFKQKTYQYYYMQILHNPYDFSFIDFEKSTFLKTDFFEENYTEVLFKNGVELKHALDNLDDLEEKILPDEIVFNDAYLESKLDMFQLDGLYYPFVINSKIHEAFLENNVSGMVMNKVDITLK